MRHAASEWAGGQWFGGVAVQHGPVQIRISLPHAVTSGIALSVTSQGCADAGVCYPPLTRAYRVTAEGTETMKIRAKFVTCFLIAWLPLLFKSTACRAMKTPSRELRNGIDSNEIFR